MDIPEWQSDTNPAVWKAMRFSTIAICVLGILGNVSSVLVLGRHLRDISGSRLLLALGIADLGVVTAITARILAFVAYGYSRLTRVLEWWFLYCYYCSIYITILLSVDRYMQSAKSMLLLRINYRKILKIVISAVFAAMLVITLPHLLGNFIKYHFKNHLIKFNDCFVTGTCQVWENEEEYDYFYEYNCESFNWIKSKSAPEKYRDVILNACRSLKSINFTINCRQGYSVPAPKFVPAMVIVVQWGYIWACDHTADFMRHDPDFVKSLYLGVDLPLRYVIPCITLVIVNVRLVLAVRRAHIQHAEITGTARVSLLKLPILKTVAAIVVVFLVCHTGGSAIFIMDIVRMFQSGSVSGNYLHGDVNTLLGDTTHTNGLVFQHLGFLLAALNSSVNALIYAMFLPTFRNHWREMFWLKSKPKSHKPPKAAVAPWEELQDEDANNSREVVQTCMFNPSIPTMTTVSKGLYV